MTVQPNADRRSDADRLRRAARRGAAPLARRETAAPHAAGCHCAARYAAGHARRQGGCGSVITCGHERSDRHAAAHSGRGTGERCRGGRPGSAGGRQGRQLLRARRPFFARRPGHRAPVRGLRRRFAAGRPVRVPTVAGLASAVERARRETPPTTRSPIPVADAEGETPLSPAQAPIWRAARALPGVPLFAIPTLLRLEGPLAIDLLQRSLTELTRRHRILSAVVSERAGEPAHGRAAADPLRTAGRGSPGSARKPARRSAPGAGRRGAGQAVRSAQRAAAAGGVGPAGSGGARAVPDPASHRGGRRGGRHPGRGTGGHLRGVRGRARLAAARSCAPIRRLGALAGGVAAESRGAGAARLLAEATRRRARSSRTAHRTAAHHPAHLSLRARAASWPRR